MGNPFAAVFFTGVSNTSSQRTGGVEFTSLSVNQDGSVTSVKSAAGSWTAGPLAGTWFNPSGGTPGNSFWVRVTVTAGGFTGGSASGAWLALSTDQSWTLQANSSGTVSATATIEIAADAAGASIIATITGIVVSATFI